MITWSLHSYCAKEAGHPPQVQEEWAIQQPVLQKMVAESTTQHVYCTHFSIIYHSWMGTLLTETITMLMHTWLRKGELYVGEDTRLNVHGPFVLFKIKLEKKVVQVMQKLRLTCETGC